MKHVGLILFFTSLLLVVGWNVSSNNSNETFATDIEYTDGTLMFKGGEIQVALAETNLERQTGLSRQRTIGENEGLLFIFNESAEQRIWMRDMYFPIDIIWLDDDFEIVDIKKNATPESFRSVRDREVFTPRMPARYVLEARSGFAGTHNLVTGDTFSLTRRR
ncbi:MAG: DUF192 domain-containing protein [Candidatus Paceibacterota bacterium]